MHLNLGCGNIRYDKIIGIDIRKTSATDAIATLELLPFKNGIIEYIIAEDIIEHFERRKVLDLLKEWHRVLKSNGSIRLKTPYFSFILHLFATNQISQEEAARRLYGDQDYPYNYHYTVYDPEPLKQILLQAGFSEVKFIGTEYTNFIIEAQK